MANIRTKAAAAYLGLSKSSLEKYRLYGGGPDFIKLGRSVIYTTQDLDAWLAAHRQAGAANDNAKTEVAAA